jgi:hypothetical protein
LITCDDVNDYSVLVDAMSVNRLTHDEVLAVVAGALYGANLPPFVRQPMPEQSAWLSGRWLNPYHYPS